MSASTRWQRAPWLGFSTLVTKERRQTQHATAAWLILGLFLAIQLFQFFWGHAWFSRNLADMRPMFEDLPILFIFLAAAMSMKSWSEEKQRGTFEFLFTLPQPLGTLVLAKFVAQWQWLILALILTLPLPLSLHFAVTPLDWGPIVGGYLAALFVGAAYLAMGQFASATTDNPITALLWAVALGAGFYLIGAPALTDFVDVGTANVMRALGSGSRFAAIARGVLDWRDLAYYLTLTGMFLILTTWRLAQEGRSPRFREVKSPRPPLNKTLILVAANLLMLHAWVLPWGNALRLDLTQDRRFSLSPITLRTLKNIATPVLIRGYFSQKTHPLLAPLQSELIDRLQEMAQYQSDRLRVEIIDPTQSPAREEEANTRYHIRPLSFRINDRYQASMVSAYFQVLVQVGDQDQVLSVRDLLDFKVSPGGESEVRLRNPEYEVLRAIRNVQAAFGEDAQLQKTIALMLPPVVSGENAPPELVEAMASGILQFDSLERALKENYQVERIHHLGALAKKPYAAVMVAAPRQLPAEAVDALKAFQQQGGAVVLITSPFQPLLTSTSLGIQTIQSGLESWLASFGVSLGTDMVLDTQNEPFPTMSTRTLANGFNVPEMLLAPYPYFVAVRETQPRAWQHSSSNLAQTLTQGLAAVTVPWASPINLNAEALPSSWQAEPLLMSSATSWRSANLEVTPTLTEQGGSGFAPQGKQAPAWLALMLQHKAPHPTAPIGSLAIINANAFASDGIENLLSMAAGQPIRASQQWVQNLVDAMLGNTDLLAIRARTSLGNRLPTLTLSQKRMIEWGNEGFALVGLLLLMLLARLRHRARLQQYAKIFHS